MLLSPGPLLQSEMAAVDNQIRALSVVSMEVNHAVGVTVKALALHGNLIRSFELQPERRHNLIISA